LLLSTRNDLEGVSGINTLAGCTGLRKGKIEFSEKSLQFSIVAQHVPCMQLRETICALRKVLPLQSESCAQSTGFFNEPPCTLSVTSTQGWCRFAPNHGGRDQSSPWEQQLFPSPGNDRLVAGLDDREKFIRDHQIEAVQRKRRGRQQVVADTLNRKLLSGRIPLAAP